MPRVTDPGSRPVAPAANPQSPSRTTGAGVATPAATNTGWVPRSGFDPSRPTAGLAGPAAAAAAAAAHALSPQDALKLVKNGDVELTLPVQEGDLVAGKLHAKANTQIKVSLHVRDGLIDYAKSNAKFDPPLDGPWGIDVRGVRMENDGRARVDLANLPDPVIGDPSPPKLADFIEQMQRTKSLPVRVWGMKLTSVDMPATDGTGWNDLIKMGKDPLVNRIKTGEARISVSNLSFVDGAVPIGGVGRAQIGPDSVMKLEGSLDSLTLTGHASLQRLDVDSGGTKIQGGSGSADLKVVWNGKASAGVGDVKAQVTNLNVQAEYAVSRRENGDFIELAQGRLTNGSLSVDQQVGGAGARTVKLDIGRFDGNITNGQITVPDGNGTATVRLSRSKLGGEVHVDDSRILVKGDVQIDARIDNAQTPANEMGSFDLNKVHVSGTSKVNIDSSKGLKLDGNMRVEADVAKGSLSVNAGHEAGRITGGHVDVRATSLEYSKDGQLGLKGRATVDVGLKDVDIGEKVVKLDHGTGRMTGSADISLRNGQVDLSKGTLRLAMAVEDGRVKLGDNVDLDLKKGSTMDVALQAAAFGNKTMLDFGPKTRIEATLDGGTIALPTGEPLKFKDGAKATFQFDRLLLPEKGIPEAQGSISIDASVEAGQIDPGSLGQLPGVTITHIEGVDQHLKLDVGRFSVQRDGAFSVEDLRFGVEAQVRRFGGVVR